MATRCVFAFYAQPDAQKFMDDRVVAMVYKHWDGYPESIIPLLQDFFAELDTHVQDRRYNDPSYLAAKLVVYLADRTRDSNDHKLEFLDVGVVMEAPSDVEYRYEILCYDLEGGHPRVSAVHIHSGNVKHYKFRNKNKEVSNA